MRNTILYVQLEEAPFQGEHEHISKYPKQKKKTALS
jgi:hypothetical protein